MANLDTVQHVSMSAASLAKTITVTVTVTGLPVMRLRWWLAAGLLRLAARIAGCGLEITRPIVPRPEAGAARLR